MIELTDQSKMDIVRICRGGKYQTTQEMIEAFREWVSEVYQERAVRIDGRVYPPGTRKVKVPCWSMLYEGEDATEKRYVKRYGKTDFIRWIWSARERTSSREHDLAEAKSLMDTMSDEERELAERIYAKEA